MEEWEQILNSLFIEKVHDCILPLSDEHPRNDYFDINNYIKTKMKIGLMVKLPIQ